MNSWRLNKFLCIVMFNHYKPAQLYKIMLEELPEYKKLKKCSVFDYVPEWKKREEEGAKRRTAGNRTSAAPPAPQPVACIGETAGYAAPDFSHRRSRSQRKLLRK